MVQGMAKTDEEIVTASLDGDPQAFEELIRRYQRLVFNIVYHYLGRRDEVEDVAQEVFLKVYRSLPTYDVARPLKAWISRIAVNSCLDELRRARKRKATLFSDVVDPEGGGLEQFLDRFQQGTRLSEHEAESLFRRFRGMIERLAEKDKMAFMLRELEGLEYSEIAEAMATTEVAVRIRVSRSKKQLVEWIGLGSGGGERR